MKAVILAGGRGTRLQAVTRGEIPKPMVPLNGKPVLEHLLCRLAASGVTEVCCTLQCLPEPIEDYFGDGKRFGLHIQYRREEKPLGTAGAVKNCRDFWAEAPFFVLSGDGLFDFDLRPLMEAHRRHENAVTMALYPHASPMAYGLAVTDTRGFVRGFIEKPGWERVVTDLVNTGIYVVSPGAMDHVPPDTPFDFARDLFPLLLERGERLFGLPLEGYWRDIGDPASYYRANLDLLEGRVRSLCTPEEKPAEQEQTADAPAAHYRCSFVLSTPRRARLMRSVSAALMEAGADFTDGITLRSAPGGLHITPERSAEAIRIESNDPATAQRYLQLAEKLRNIE